MGKLFATTLCALALAAGLAAEPAAAAFEGDLTPRLAGGTIAVDGVSDEDGSVGTNLSVFQYTLGDTTPGFTEDPGLQPEPGSGLPANSYLGFNIAGPLLYWNGAGTPLLVPAPPGPTFQLYIGGSFHVEITGATVAQNGFVAAQLDASGHAHQHLSAQALGLADITGTYLDSQGNTYDAPDDGIYAFPIILTDDPTNTTASTSFVSEKLWLVYNQNMSDEQLTAAADTLQSVPEPASLCVLAAGGLLLLVRRR